MAEQVLFWVQMVLKRLSLLSRRQAKEEATKSMLGIEPPLEGQFYAVIDKIESLFASMDLVDKTQFPFPYSQIMKILLYFWMLAQPFVLEIQCGAATPAVMVLIGIGFFGLDEVAEILESPFGNDPNDIDLIVSADDLVNDVEMLFEKANAPITPVLHDTEANKHFFGQLNLDTVDRRGDEPSSASTRHARSVSRTHLVAGGAKGSGWSSAREHLPTISAKANSTPERAVEIIQTAKQRSGTPPIKRPEEALPPSQQGAQP